jgi:dsDNA-specific endonuclease/ATPase MutS2
LVLSSNLQQERDRIEKIAISYGERYQTCNRAINILSEQSQEAKKNYQEWVQKLRAIEKQIEEAENNKNAL